MSKLETPAAVAVVGLAGFQLWDAWHKNAPSLAQVRGVQRGDDGFITVAQNLLDASLTVGSLALIIGITVLFLSGDWAVLLIMLAIFAALATWHYQVLISEQR